MDAYAFPQVLLPGYRQTRGLKSTFARTANELTLELKAMVSSNSKVVKVVGISILLTVDGQLEAVALAAQDKIVVFYPRNVKESKHSIEGCSAFTSLLTDHDHGSWLVSFGMTRVAFHIRGNLKVHVRGVEIADAFLLEDRTLSPGAIIKDHIDPCADSFMVNRVWDPVTEETKDDPERLQNLCLRAWLAAL